MILTIKLPNEFLREGGGKYPYQQYLLWLYQVHFLLFLFSVFASKTKAHTLVEENISNPPKPRYHLQSCLG